jgi:hypothetical protein
MRKFTPAEMLDLVHQVLQSPEYGKRLDAIHKHYPNVKSEGRYRDALLEIFNDEQEKTNSGLRAFAEAKRHDLVITQEGLDEEGWLRIEMKYHFTFDFAHRVQSKLDELGPMPTFAVDGRGDLHAITRDCLHSKNAGSKCDAFILIVQDRFEASRRYGTKGYPVVKERGVTMQFLHEQLKLQDLYREGYEQAWRTPLEAMLRAIGQERAYSPKETIRHTVAPSLDIPLTSHIYVLDFSE